jgi:hypothetical protein
LTFAGGFASFRSNTSVIETPLEYLRDGALSFGYQWRIFPNGD